MDKACSATFPPILPQNLTDALHGAECIHEESYYEELREWCKKTTETIDDRLQRYLEYLRPTASSLIKITSAFEHELELGLNEHLASPFKFRPEKCSFKMLDSCVPSIPTGRESGTVYALDFGGTNVRVVRGTLEGNGSIKIKQVKQSLMDVHVSDTRVLKRGLLDRQATAADLFGLFARLTRQLMEQEGDILPSRRPSYEVISITSPQDSQKVADAKVTDNPKLKIFSSKDSQETAASGGSPKSSQSSDGGSRNSIHSSETQERQAQLISPGTDDPEITALQETSLVKSDQPEPTSYPLHRRFPSNEPLLQYGDALGEIPIKFNAGFCFSFPCIQRSLDGARLIEWTKGFETGRGSNDPIEGLDVALLMNVAFARERLPLSVTAVVNDTVGVLLAGAYAAGTLPPPPFPPIERLRFYANLKREPNDPEIPTNSFLKECNSENPPIGLRCFSKRPPVVVGLILGTGINAAYYEEDAKAYGYLGHIINVECGNFNRCLPLTNVDYEVDFLEVSNRGKQRLEKMLSGAYLGEITRRAILKVLQNRAPPAAWSLFSLDTAEVSQIARDNTANLIVSNEALYRIWRFRFPYDDLKRIQQLAIAVLDRAAALAAVVIAATGRKTRRIQPAMGGISVAIDGSLYKFTPLFQKRMRVHLGTILGDHVADNIHVVTVNDGSGKGAAIIAAMGDG